MFNECNGNGNIYFSGVRSTTEILNESEMKIFMIFTSKAFILLFYDKVSVVYKFKMVNTEQNSCFFLDKGLWPSMLYTSSKWRNSENVVYFKIHVFYASGRNTELIVKWKMC